MECQASRSRTGGSDGEKRRLAANPRSRTIACISNPPLAALPPIGCSLSGIRLLGVTLTEFGRHLIRARSANLPDYLGRKLINTRWPGWVANGQTKRVYLLQFDIALQTYLH